MSPTATAVPYRMSALELACSMVWGTDPAAEPLPAAPGGLTARAALEDAVLPALLRPPCIVSFSGGRDSSAILALAVHVARREGLPLPVPVSQRFPGCEGSDEDKWQELLIRHLGIAEWSRLVFDDELDSIGPFAQTVMERHGLLWPFNAHFHLPVVAQAPGGSMLTGFGGDELLMAGWTWDRVNQVLAGRRRWTRRDVVRFAAAYGPAPLRRAVLRRRLGLDGCRRLAWLRPAAASAMTAEFLREMATEPVNWIRGVDVAWWRTRCRSVAEESLSLVGGICDVEVVHPLTDPVVLATVAAEGGRTGFPSRTAAMEHLVGDLIPPQLTTRPSKAHLTNAFWNRHSRAFAADWNGTGVDLGIVDDHVLRRIWTGHEQPPDARSFSLLQAGWLASRRPAGGPAPVP